MKNRQFQQENEKNLPRQKCLDRVFLYRDIVFVCRDIISKEPAEAMSQQSALCSKKDQAELS